MATVAEVKKKRQEIKDPALFLKWYRENVEDYTKTVKPQYLERFKQDLIKGEVN